MDADKNGDETIWKTNLIWYWKNIMILSLDCYIQYELFWWNVLYCLNEFDFVFFIVWSHKRIRRISFFKSDSYKWLHPIIFHDTNTAWKLKNGGQDDINNHKVSLEKMLFKLTRKIICKESIHFSVFDIYNKYLILNIQ